MGKRRMLHRLAAWGAWFSITLYAWIAVAGPYEPYRPRLDSAVVYWIAVMPIVVGLMLVQFVIAMATLVAVQAAGRAFLGVEDVLGLPRLMPCCRSAFASVTRSSEAIQTVPADKANAAHECADPYKAPRRFRRPGEHPDHAT